MIVHYAKESNEDDYPDEVTLVAKNEVTVSVNPQIWCVTFSNGLINHKDEINYCMESVIAKIDPPTVAGNRRQFTLHMGISLLSDT